MQTFREEILRIFQLLIWEIDDFINSFWLYLTYSTTAFVQLFHVAEHIVKKSVSNFKRQQMQWYWCWISFKCPCTNYKSRICTEQTYGKMIADYILCFLILKKFVDFCKDNNGCLVWWVSKYLKYHSLIEQLLLYCPNKRRVKKVQK